ncbi:unnamed protein product [Moneuplotes crassus]|uniref:Glutathione S-transferase n=1 Tax=Euplotes crassus TaxID=5936 RepID=A0AAD2D3U7_EUPCR|nr:unnamed protein product [Moneuplotes crassus]
MKLYYFDVYGKGESIRLLLTHSKAEWEDVRLGGPSWQEFKAEQDKCKYGQLPILEKDGKHYPQSLAILRYLGGVHGYYPEDLELRFQADEITDLIVDDFFVTIVKKYIFVKDEEEKKQSWTTLLEEHHPKHFGFLENQLKGNSSQEFLVGDSYTIADFAAIAAYISQINHPDRRDDVLPILEKFPLLKAYFEARTADFQEYIENLPKCSV